MPLIWESFPCGAPGRDGPGTPCRHQPTGLDLYLCVYPKLGSMGASHSPVLVACACFSLSHRLIFLHFLEETASVNVSKCKQYAHTSDGSFSTSPVAAVLGALVLRRGFLSPWEGCLTRLEWTGLAQLLLPELWSQLLPRPPRPAFLYISLPSFSSNYGTLSYWVFLFLFSLERDNHSHTPLQPGLVSVSKILEDILGNSDCQLPKEGPASFNLGAC